MGMSSFEVNTIIKKCFSYINDGKKAKKIYDAGTIELSGKFKGFITRFYV
jgi:hypothetical protein